MRLPNGRELLSYNAIVMAVRRNGRVHVYAYAPESTDLPAVQLAWNEPWSYAAGFAIDPYVSVRVIVEWCGNLPQMTGLIEVDGMVWPYDDDGPDGCAWIGQPPHCPVCFEPQPRRFTPMGMGAGHWYVICESCDRLMGRLP